MEHSELGRSSFIKVMGTRTINLQDLSKYSPEFQYGVLKFMIEDYEFQSKAGRHLDVNTFNVNEVLRRLAGWVKDYIRQGVSVSYDLLFMKIDAEIADSVTKDMMVDTLKKARSMEFTPSSASFLKEDVFAMVQMDRALYMRNQIDELLKKGKVRKDVGEMVDLYYKEFKTVTGICDYQPVPASSINLDDVINAREAERIPTSSAALNKYTNGGLAKGDICLVLAGTGIGKTCFTSGIIADAALKGRKTVHIVLEDKEADIEKKYVAYFTNVPASDIKSREADVKDCVARNTEWYNTMRDNIVTIYAVTEKSRMKHFTVADMDTMLLDLENNGYIPEVVVIDYFDCIKASGGKDAWVKDENTINELMELAINHNIALYVPTQGGKAAQNSKADLELDSIKGGSWRSFRAQLVISLQPYGDDTKIKLLKNRYGQRKEFITDFNNGTCRFGKKCVEISDPVNAVDEALGYQMDTARSIINR